MREGGRHRVAGACETAGVDVCNALAGGKNLMVVTLNVLSISSVGFRTGKAVWDGEEGGGGKRRCKKQ